MEINQRMVAIILLIVVLVVVILFIVHAMKIKKTPGNGGRVHVYGTYVVTVGQKTSVASSFSDSYHDKCFYINGMEAPKLILTRNVYYEFKNESDEPIYFSSSHEGGAGAPRSLAKNQASDFIGLAKGTIFFMVTDDLPDSFYYQSGKTRGMGGLVQVR